MLPRNIPEQSCPAESGGKDLKEYQTDAESVWTPNHQPSRCSQKLNPGPKPPWFWLASEPLKDLDNDCCGWERTHSLWHLHGNFSGLKPHPNVPLSGVNSWHCAWQWVWMNLEANIDGAFWVSNWALPQLPQLHGPCCQTLKEPGKLGHFLDHNLQKCGKGRKLLSRGVFHELIRNVLINPLEVKGETCPHHPLPTACLKGPSWSTKTVAKWSFKNDGSS